MNSTDVVQTVTELGAAAKAAAPHLLKASDHTIVEALAGMARLLKTNEGALLEANAADVAAAAESGLSTALTDRLRLDAQRLAAMAAQLQDLAAAPALDRRRVVRDLGDGFVVEEWRRPVGVIGATFEARPNVVIDIASQLLRSANAGVLRTGGAAMRSSAALVDLVIGPALAEQGLPPEAVQLIRIPDRAAAFELVRHPSLIPLVIVRGSGETTRLLGREAAHHGVHTLAHADGGGVAYIARSADAAIVHETIRASLDRLGVCNRLNLLLIDRAAETTLWPPVRELLGSLGIRVASPEASRSRGHEWANDDGNEATVTVDWVDSAEEAAGIANEETSGLAATVLTADAAEAQRFITAYGGTGVFWNTTTRRLDGYRLLGLPETGINVDHVPGPRGPVTFHDLCLRQYVVVPQEG
ncbi:aldehyde dehydrogenase family protein [Sinosporangium siamense]|uniref:Gamma-glutamyl-phosphate reductase n=1 Tax=Sinosporangium siamense TaxID=1367973 RepID=A0A919RNF7_9ACTN|nr:aldehyde dehydrogenase family protein [Sinosporangium siamense]GII96773.1 gamma-glutamyl-phosphate reductase [Sinosporangium siamense]